MRKTLTILTVAAALLLALHAAPALAGDAGVYADLVEHYEPVRTALLHDNVDGVAEHAEAIAATVRGLEKDFSAERAGVPAAEAAAVKELLPRIAEAADALAAAEDVGAARKTFGDLSTPLIRWHGLLDGAVAGLAVGSCPMVEDGWLQPAQAELGNPYMGQAMATCGKLEQS